ncbi:unnamed protein product [Protopolystoma xenopodis]|uniref:Uncharacterized protein n=1 Tax=Protopolystoma xenopodis TaxID=117903 RepID=A0A3S5B0N1_9PLAT|nr:unnamed protein product [Protopolystoma xenopodis]
MLRYISMHFLIAIPFSPLSEAAFGHWRHHSLALFSASFRGELPPPTDVWLPLVAGCWVLRLLAFELVWAIPMPSLTGPSAPFHQSSKPKSQPCTTLALVSLVLMHMPFFAIAQISSSAHGPLCPILLYSPFAFASYVQVVRELLVGSRQIRSLTNMFHTDWSSIDSCVNG